MSGMHTVWGKWKRRLRGFHENEDGMEAIQVVMIVAIAALVLIAFFTVGDRVFEWVGKMLTDLFDIPGFTT